MNPEDLKQASELLSQAKVPTENRMAWVGEIEMNENDKQGAAWPCKIIESDFEQDTITVQMQNKDYFVSGGTFWLSMHKQSEQFEAWQAVVKTLDEVCPSWTEKDKTGRGAACIAIRELAQPERQYYCPETETLCGKCESHCEAAQPEKAKGSNHD